MIWLSNFNRDRWAGALGVIPMGLVSVAIIGSAFGSWPFERSRIWQMLNPANVAVVVCTFILIGWWLLRSDSFKVYVRFPHLCVFAYLTINVLSVSFASDLGRALSFSIKLVLMFVGGFALFSSAISSRRLFTFTHKLITAAVVISIGACFVTGFGFHGSGYKYGTYIAILIPLGSTYLLASSKLRNCLAGSALVAGSIVSCGSAGGIVAIAVGMFTAMIVMRRWQGRVCVLGAVVVGVILLFFIAPASVLDDMRLAEGDGRNLKQRYIEWQAEINLLTQRAIAGTGAGCINDHRSNFYYRLPKLNTLRPFDQNGWLTVAAETGIWGLVCFCWIMVHYGRLAIVSVRRSSGSISIFAKANLAAFVAACVANLFSSVQYNGILIVFVLLLSLIAKTNSLSEEPVNAD